MDDPKKTVLVIDDDAHIRRILELKCRVSGFEVLSAKNGEQGFEIIDKSHPDVVITDINMPKLSGEELCRRTAPLKEAFPFLTIVITARISPDDELWIQDMKDTIFMEKPFSPLKIIEEINTYLARRADDE